MTEVLISILDPRVVPLMQFVSSSLLTLMSIVVALVALHFGFRNNFGWEPIVLLVSNGTTGTGDKELGKIDVEFEVWNRRKYPIMVHHMSVVFGKMEFERHLPGRKARGWLQGNKLENHDRIRIEPNSYHPVAMTGLSRNAFEADFCDAFEIRVLFFDPKSNKYKTIKTRSDFDLREPGEMSFSHAHQERHRA